MATSLCPKWVGRSSPRLRPPPSGGRAAPAAAAADRSSVLALPLTRPRRAAPAPRAVCAASKGRHDSSGGGTSTGSAAPPSPSAVGANGGPDLRREYEASLAAAAEIVSQLTVLEVRGGGEGGAFSAWNAPEMPPVVHTG